MWTLSRRVHILNLSRPVQVSIWDADVNFSITTRDTSASCVKSSSRRLLKSLPTLKWKPAAFPETRLNMLKLLLGQTAGDARASEMSFDYFQFIKTLFYWWLNLGLCRTNLHLLRWAYWGRNYYQNTSKCLSVWNGVGKDRFLSELCRMFGNWFLRWFFVDFILVLLKNYAKY